MGNIFELFVHKILPLAASWVLLVLPVHNDLSGINHSSVLKNTTIQKTSDIVTVSKSYSYLGNDISANIQFPRNGGRVTGIISGSCNGTINGIYDGKENGKTSGTMEAKCDAIIFSMSGDWTGVIHKQTGKVDLHVSGSAGPLSKSIDLTLSFIPAGK